MNISVIIPVYNAAPFIKEAVSSAIYQKYVSEVILVEDGSIDNSLEICTQLAKEDKRIKVFTHSKNMNEGPGKSRNLGIMAATGGLIAFLDADDYYLPNRFDKAVKYLVSHPDLDGVAEAIGSKFEEREGKERFLSHLNLPPNLNEEVIKTGMQKEVPPEKLFESLFLGKNGHLHLNGLLVKKTVFEKTGFFSDMEIAQDSSFIARLAYTCKIKVFNTDAVVAIRRIHKGNRWNRSLKKRMKYYALYIQDVFHFVDHDTLSPPLARKLIQAYVRCHHPGYFETENKFYKLYLQFTGYCKLVFRYRALIRSAL